MRRLPATVWSVTVATVTVALQVAPPLVERNARIAVSLALAIGTMTVPLGCTTGWPPRPVGVVAGVQGRAPGQAAVGRGAHLHAGCRRRCRPTRCSSCRRTGWSRCCRRRSSSCRAAAAGDGDVTGLPQVSAAVGGAADEHAGTAVTDAVIGSEEISQTLCMGVDRRRGSLTRWNVPVPPLILGDAGQRAAGPGAAAVGAGGEADVRARRRRRTGRSEAHHQPAAEGERVGLDLVACWLVVLVNGSLMIRVNPAGSACAVPGASSAAAISDAAAHARRRLLDRIGPSSPGRVATATLRRYASRRQEPMSRLTAAIPRRRTPAGQRSPSPAAAHEPSVLGRTMLHSARSDHRAAFAPEESRARAAAASSLQIHSSPGRNTRSATRRGEVMRCLRTTSTDVESRRDADRRPSLSLCANRSTPSSPCGG